MSSIPNRFNFYDDHENMNKRKFSPIEMNLNSKVVRSMFSSNTLTSDHTNHGDMFSSSSSFSFHQNSQASSSSFGFKNSPETNFSGADYFSVKGNPHLTRVSFTQTITNRYTAIVPTNTLNNVHYSIERVKRALNSRTNIFNPTFYPQPVLQKQCEILNPKPLNVIFPHQDSAYPQHLNLSSSNHNHSQHISQDGRLFKPSLTTNHFKKSYENIDYEKDDESDDDQYDGRTHSLPYDKHGPYTCPKCNNVFDTCQKFASHMSFHYKGETIKERYQRLRARNKGKYRKLSKFMQSLKRSNQRMGSTSVE